MTVKWVGKRMMLGALVLFIVSFLSFFIMHAGSGTSATAYYGGNVQTLTAAEIERINKAFALDRPIIVQYGAWLKETVQGNLGISVKEGRPVAAILVERLPNTLLLVGVSMFFIITGSIWLGSHAGMRPGTLLDKGLTAFSIASSSIPAFWLGILFIYIFAVTLGVLPSSGTRSVSGHGGLVDNIKHLIMPVSVVFLTHVGLYARFLQESVKSEISSYYVMAARANGVDEREIRRGVMRNSFIPYLNYLGITIPSFFGGSVIVESLFSWPGLGQLLVKSVMVKDYPMLMGGIMLTGLIVVISLLIIDVLMYILDPKLRRGELDG